MLGNYRALLPVGQGGFDVERIDGTTIVFDCGSTPRCNVENCIIHYHDELEKLKEPLVIDYLFFSHFDKDHVNGLKILAQYFQIKNIIVPYIPKRYRVVYNYVTDLAVTSFYKLLAFGKLDNLNEVRILGTNHIKTDNLYQSVKSSTHKWEWVYKSLFSRDQWDDLLIELQGCGVDIERRSDDDEYFYENINNPLESWEEKVSEISEKWHLEGFPDNSNFTEDGISIEDFDIDSYKSEVELNMDQIGEINNAIGRISGMNNRSFAKNENGLLMLSKKNIVPAISINVFKQKFPWSCFYLFGESYCSRRTACIYTGDMKFEVRSCATILDFLRMVNEPLLLFQIPHHGSSHNSSATYLQKLPSEIFFWHDKDLSRMRKNGSVVNNIIGCRCILIDTVNGFVHGIDLF